MSDLKLSADETSLLNDFFIQLIDRIGKICLKAKQFLPEVQTPIFAVFRSQPQ